MEFENKPLLVWPSRTPRYICKRSQVKKVPEKSKMFCKLRLWYCAFLRLCTRGVQAARLACQLQQRLDLRFDLSIFLGDLRFDLTEILWLRFDLRFDLTKFAGWWFDLRFDLMNVWTTWFDLWFDLTSFLALWFDLRFDLKIFQTLDLIWDLIWFPKSWFAHPYVALTLGQPMSWGLL